jgi:16S rRNA (cytosine1402-N4)-methyltransferase
MFHESVLLKSSIESLDLLNRKCIIDATLGLGGHSEAILSHPDFSGSVIGIDQDMAHLRSAEERLQKFGDRFRAVHANFGDLESIVQSEKLSFDGILYDLGVASPHLDIAERGFSFHESGPLDMRMNATSEDKTAADLVNSLPQEELAQIFWRFGDEPLSRAIARAICEDREGTPFTSTTQLAELIVSVYRSSRKRSPRHPATRVFQALRIAVNDEMNVLDRSLDACIDLIQAEGRIVVISYHSLEDRMVKRRFRQEANPCICPPKQPLCTCGKQASLRIITRKAIIPNDDEIENNPRSRSAKMRIAEKISEYPITKSQ